MEEVTVFPVDDTVSGGNPITSVCVEEPDEQMNGDVVTMKEEELINAESANIIGVDDAITESSTPITRSASCRPARRKRGAFGLFRVVFLSFSRSDSTKQKTEDEATTPKKKKAGAGNVVIDSDKLPASSWKSIVDGMRPLRLPGQELEYYPPPPPPLAGHVDVYHDVALAPPFPMRSGSEGGMTSRYASAQDLHMLDCGEQEKDKAEGAPAAEDASCPHAIDMQAEKFIAKFYQQFRLQKSESSNGRATDESTIDQHPL